MKNKQQLQTAIQQLSHDQIFTIDEMKEMHDLLAEDPGRYKLQKEYERFSGIKLERTR